MHKKAELVQQRLWELGAAGGGARVSDGARTAADAA
jgi:hypothetical protein